ncbi:MAG: hypothetical protein H6657_10780 [Ardenticatenaceae bacterium]|nr:hypothetical protein [Ardenticatenaceae bacterium]
MNKNVRNALVGLLVFVGLFACGILIEVKFFGESLCFAVLGVLMTLGSLAFWELISDSKQK